MRQRVELRLEPPQTSLISLWLSLEKPEMIEIEMTHSQAAYTHLPDVQTVGAGVRRVHDHIVLMGSLTSLLTLVMTTHWQHCQNSQVRVWIWM